MELGADTKRLQLLIENTSRSKSISIKQLSETCQFDHIYRLIKLIALGFHSNYNGTKMIPGKKIV